MKKIIIAIDGHSSTGKGTLAKQLAKALNYIYVDSGAMYRAITLYAIENKFLTPYKFDEIALINSLEKLDLEFKTDVDKNSALLLNGQLVSSKIRGLEVSNRVSMVAAVADIRKSLVKKQRQMGRNKGIVMDGRDIGTVVFPQAELKIFMTASAEIRAHRRFDQMSKIDACIDYKAVYDNIVSRDQKDSTRKDSPLKQAKDAMVLDNSNMDKDQQFQIAMAWVKSLTYE